MNKADVVTALDMRINYIETGSVLYSAQDLVNMAGESGGLVVPTARPARMQALDGAQIELLADLRRLRDKLQSTKGPEYPEGTCCAYIVENRPVLGMEVVADLPDGKGSVVRVRYIGRHEECGFILDGAYALPDVQGILDGNPELEKKLRAHAESVANAWRSNKWHI